MSEIEGLTYREELEDFKTQLYGDEGSSSCRALKTPRISGYTISADIPGLTTEIYRHIDHEPGDVTVIPLDESDKPKGMRIEIEAGSDYENEEFEQMTDDLWAESENHEVERFYPARRKRTNELFDQFGTAGRVLGKTGNELFLHSFKPIDWMITRDVSSRYTIFCNYDSSEDRPYRESDVVELSNVEMDGDNFLRMWAVENGNDELVMRKAEDIADYLDEN